MKKAIVIGASSGIGYAVALDLAARGFRVGCAARRESFLRKLQGENSNIRWIRPMDVRDPSRSVGTLHEMIRDMNGTEWIILNAGINPSNPELDPKKESEVIATNVSGFSALAAAAYHYFEEQGRGHLAGISSIAGVRGSPLCPAYSASKAYMSNYLEALWLRNRNAELHITDIRPGFVDTAMIAGSPVKFWVASPEAAARQIVTAIRKSKRVAYVTKRYALLAGLYRLCPPGLLKPAFDRALRSC